MDRRLIRTVENEYPYPVAIEFRRLNTSEYVEYDYKRLKQILTTAERTAHFLALTALSDLIENIPANTVIPETFQKEFTRRFTRSTFGKWIALLRDAVTMAKKENIPLFVHQMIDFFIAKKGESEAQKAFNQLTALRNKFEHRDFNPTAAEFKDYTLQAESLLEILFKELEFILDYRFVYVHEVTVDNHRWHDARFRHTLAEVIGLTSKFSCFQKEDGPLMHTPAVVILKENSDAWLPLEPLVLYSEEGERRVPDIFMYMDFDAGGAKYLPSENGGEFLLERTSAAKIHSRNLLRFFDTFALPGDRDKIKSFIDGGTRP